MLPRNVGSRVGQQGRWLVGVPVMKVVRSAVGSPGNKFFSFYKNCTKITTQMLLDVRDLCVAIFFARILQEKYLNPNQGEVHVLGERR